MKNPASLKSLFYISDLMFEQKRDQRYPADKRLTKKLHKIGIYFLENIIVYNKFFVTVW